MTRSLRQAALAASPVAAFEFSFGVWLIVRGFRPEAMATLGKADFDSRRREMVVFESVSIPAASAPSVSHRPGATRA